MSCKPRRTLTLFLITVYFNTLRASSLAGLGQEENLWTYQVKESHRREKLQTPESQQQQQQEGWRLVEQVVKSPSLGKSKHPGITEFWEESAAFPGETVQHFSVPESRETHGDSAHNASFWIAGNISPRPRSFSSGSEPPYQADFTGFAGVQGTVYSPSLDSGPHLREWQSLRPLVQCDQSVMTFTASGEGLTQLFVDREGASPISLFQLPSYCGYSLKSTWSDVEVMVPYDACHITQENGSYVLPMLWGSNPLKLSCPVQMTPPAPSSPHSRPSVFCSPDGMAVQTLWQEKDIPMLGVIVNGGWGPFVSEECAHRVHSHPGVLNFYISYSAPCITSGDGFHLQLILDDQGFILSCPVSPQSPYIPSPPVFPPAAPGGPQSPYIPAPVSPATTSPPPPPQPPTQQQVVQLPDYSDYLYPGFHYSQLPQVFPPGAHPARPHRPTLASPPGQQPKPQVSLYPSGSGKVPSHQETDIPNLVQDRSPHQVPKLPVGPYPHPPGGYYSYVPLYYPVVSADPTPAATATTTTTTTPSPYYHHYYHQKPYYPAPTAEPVTQAPAPPPSSPSTPPPPPKQPVGPPQYPSGLFYPPTSYGSYYDYWQFFHPKPVPEVQPTSSPSTPHPTTQKNVPKQPHVPSGKFDPQRPSYLYPHQVPSTPGITCPPSGHTICSYYPYPYYPYFHALYPPYYQPPYPILPQYPQTPPPVKTQKPDITTPTTTSTPTTPCTTSSATTAATPVPPTPKPPRLQCLPGRMVVYLPSAHPDSIQVIAQMKTWLFLSSVSPLCGYVLQMAEGSGVILQSPLPACHSQPRTPTTISLPLRFWDLSLAQYRTLDLQCPYHPTPATPTTVPPSLAPTLPSSTKGKIHQPVVPKPEVFCYPHQMTVELPPGAVSEIFVQDINGNLMNIQDAPKSCGYSVRKGNAGKIRLTLRLHSRCHMSVQGKMYIIGVHYMTVNGRREAQFSCPAVVKPSGQECNLPSEQRLPCGHGSLSRSQCLSMGCCFSKQPPVCYYPMDECTIDRHFVFTVPASLTEPPLSPAMLVAAGNSTCRPQRVTSDYAVFKIPMDSCGARSVMVGKTMVYMVEVINMVQTLSLNYGTITRDSPVRLLVECRYVPNTVLSVSYMVKTPTLGPEVQTQGILGVQLRISKDSSYSSYYPQYHQPLQMLLGKPLYLEVRLLNAPDPNLVLLVHFCVAYPRSGKAVWLLLYNGCPNPLDPAPQQAVVFDPPPPSPRAHTRRFTISTFQFLPDGEFKDPDEEIYFMCSTEICSPRDGPCVEGCFGQ